MTDSNGNAHGPEPILKLIRRVLVGLAIATVALYLALAGVVWFIVLPRAEESNDALCALRSDLVVRVGTSKAFLREHPKGIPGITAKAIQQGIDNQQRTIDALADLSCS